MSESPPDSEEAAFPLDRHGSGADSARGKASEASRRIARLLDDFLRVPGTQIRFGLDPLLGLIPGGGETFASLLGCFLLGEAGKRGLPFRTLLKMSGNVLLNATLGAIPIAGDLFSVWFKSNARNYRLLEHFMESESGEQAAGGWWPILLILGVIATVVLVNVLSWLAILATISWLLNRG